MTPQADDPVTLRDPRRVRFFEWIMAREVAKGFRALRVMRPGLPDVPADRPLIVYTNHPGWWDPAVCLTLHAAHFPGRHAYAPMEAEALERYGFMKRIGMFGVEPGSRAGAARFLRVGGRVLADPGRVLWVTAQGRFADPRARPVELMGGLAALMARTPGAVALPVALEYPFWSEKRPEALVAFGAPQTEGAGLAAALEATMDRLAGAAIARDPAAFATVARGTQGTGGVYGAWKRLSALARGERYDPAHLSDETP